MKLSVTLLLASVGIAAAAPAISGVADELHSAFTEPQKNLFRRQGGGGSTSDELKNGPCKKVTLIFARASTEPGNMGGSMGPATCKGLKKAYNNDVACQGVGKSGSNSYTAGLPENALPKGTKDGAIIVAQDMFKMAQQKCPNSIIVAGGYSQGTAVMMNAISTLDEGLKNKVVGVVLFGYTKNGQQKSGIPKYPKEKVEVFCAKSDGVCWGALNVSAGHFSYMGNGDGPKAVAFLKGKIDGGGAPSSSSSGATGGSTGGAKGKGMKGKGGGAKGAGPPAAAAEAESPPPAAEPAAEAPAEAPAEAAPERVFNPKEDVAIYNL